jgi:hypothetical protein
LLRDIKTGAIWNKETADDGSPLLKDDYQAQLKLYAALWHLKTGQWPVRLEIMPLNGEPVEVFFTPDECALLLQEALTTLERINIAIHTVLESHPPDLAALATPDARICQYCVFRPGCAAYWRAREQSAPPEVSQWPNDVCGTLQKQQVLGNGQMMLHIVGEDGEKILVRLKPDIDRYSALQNLQEGCKAAIYNLSSTSIGAAWNDTPYTVVYFV